MSERNIISIQPISQARSVPLVRSSDAPALPVGSLVDARGRGLHDLRISVTDRCNFRCSYCMPKEVFDKNHVFLPHNQLLSFEEITRLAK
ncbi:MAG: GTP 3',8-cyclase MoaA, partial [Leptothrix sp. (in: b-proteobacteria)]